jgi:hypothetical protein
VIRSRRAWRKEVQSNERKANAESVYNDNGSRYPIGIFLLFDGGVQRLETENHILFP